MIFTSFSSFVKKDFEILQQKYKVEKYQYSNSKSLTSHFKEQVKLFFFLINNISKTTKYYIWFADYHSLLPVLFAKLFKKESYIVLGGYDVTNIPELNYGFSNKKIRKMFNYFSIKYATQNLAVSEYVKNQALKIDFKANIKLVYNIFDPMLFNYKKDITKDTILTVGLIDSNMRVRLKGIDLFIEAAKKLEDKKFVIVGISKNIQKQMGYIPGNLEMYESIEHKHLSEFYQKAFVYCQFSMVESFALSLVEAMACGCVPVITNNGALPEVIGNFGFITNNSIDDIIKNINDALEVSEAERTKIAQYVKEKFSVTIRMQKLFEILNC